MISVHLPQDLANQYGLDNPLQVAEAPTVVDLLDGLAHTHPDLAARLMLPNGSIRPHLNLFTTHARSPVQGAGNADLHPNDEIWVIRAVSGG